MAVTYKRMGGSHAVQILQICKLQSRDSSKTLSPSSRKRYLKNLLGTFGAAFDKHVPCLLKLYWARKGAFGQKMEDLLEKLDEQDTDHEERLLRGVSVAILTVIEDDDAAISPNVRDVAVVLEGTIVLHDLPDLSTAFAYLFGLLYAMNIDYPKEMRYTFEAIQNIFYELGSRCSQRIRSRKTKLLL
ncbi:hypothetical protein NQZ68_026621 [Dissostichus eleginoides]|nr:hypothetical protein NQZ68_026621 [Dissostichus eleginoides]